jgi:hypothetical protein
MKTQRPILCTIYVVRLYLESTPKKLAAHDVFGVDGQSRLKRDRWSNSTVSTVRPTS